jgi:hypothetical protein
MMSKPILPDTTPTPLGKIRAIVRAKDTSEVLRLSASVTTARGVQGVYDPNNTTYVFIEMPVVSQPSPASYKDLEERFQRLANQWRNETEHISSIAKACMHRAYQHIIGMGYDAVPLLLRELQQDPDHWFWALNAITEEDPARSEDTFDGAVSAWLEWGKREGYI